MSQRGNDGESPKKSWRRYLSCFSRPKPSQSVPGHSQPEPQEESKDEVKLKLPSEPVGPLQTEPNQMDSVDSSGLSKPTPHLEDVKETEPIQDQDGGNLMTVGVFQQLIKDRQAERKMKAEEKLLEGLKRIAALNSRDGISPIELFPKEIWAKVLDKLKPRDRLVMQHLNSVFRNLLEPNLISDTLFPLVLDCEIPFVRELAPYSDPETRRRDLKNLMALRLVSKSLRNSVDKWLEDRLLFLMRSSDSSKPRKHTVLNSVELNMSTDFTKLNDITGSLNRFPLRSIRVGFDDAEFSESRELTVKKRRNLNNRVRILQDNITEFLKKRGDQIWHADFDFLSVDIDMARYFYDVMIQEWLPLMPHLKWLELRTSTMLPRLSPLSWSDSDDEDDDENAWEPPRNRDPVTGIPTMPELERFDFDSFFARDNLRICEGVLSASPHVKYFTRELVTQSYTHMNRYNDPLVQALPLEAANIGDGEDVVSENYLTLQQICSKSWNLKWVEMWLGQGKKNEDIHQIEIEHVFGFLEQFQTLENVELHIDYLKIGEEASFLRLPNLKFFWIEFGPTVETSGNSKADAVFFSLQFLLYCGKLRSLIWEDLIDPNSSELSLRGLEDSCGEHNGIMMDFKGGRGDLRASNIWKVFPHLRAIDVQFVQGDKDNMPWKKVNREYRERRLVSEVKSKWEPEEVP